MHLKFSNQIGGGQEKNHLKGLEGIVPCIHTELETGTAPISRLKSLMTMHGALTRVLRKVLPLQWELIKHKLNIAFLSASNS